MGLKPTQYRCAAESLLRRFRKEGALPRLHPLVDLCNAVSLAFAIPVAVLDVAEIAWPLEVRYADGDEELPDVRRRGRAPGAGRGDLRRPGRPGARPPLDEPAERPCPRSAPDRRRAHRGRGACTTARPATSPSSSPPYPPRSPRHGRPSRRPPSSPPTAPAFSAATLRRVPPPAATRPRPAGRGRPPARPGRPGPAPVAVQRDRAALVRADRGGGPARPTGP